MKLSISAALALTVVVAFTSAAPEAQRRRAPGTSAPGARDERTLTVGGRTRSYLVHDFAGNTAPAPVVIVLHGGGGNAENAVQMTGFDRLAARERFIVVYPNGTGGREGTLRRRAARERDILLTWNAGHCCASAMVNRVDDVRFIEQVIDELVASGRGDATRVYVTGMSNGAMMAHRLGRELSTKIAAIAPVVGATFGDEPAPDAPVAAFIIVGADDQTVPANGGSLKLRGPAGNTSAADRDVAPAMDQATYWARHDGCGQPVRRDTSVSDRTEWASCRGGTSVVFHSVKNNGHAWPGGQPGRQGAAVPTTAFDATEEMWAFFTRHRINAN
ncbi:MAG: polyhydroxybutyrate depolymerase [Acidobacteria bacterium]|nr:polyhydroxybutyrate depolymerase [Acidobacteriota bacterium]